MQSTRAVFLQGLLHSLPFSLVMVPFGLLFGVVATEAGLDLIKTFSFSVVVVAGAAQFSAISLIAENAPTLVIILTALAVNLRMAMYSATLAPYLGKAKLWQKVLIAYGTVDQSFVLSDRAFQTNTDWQLNQRIAYFFGSTVFVCFLWMAATVVGALIGAQLPAWIALDFAIPITFIALFAPGLRSLAHVAAAMASVTFALLLSFVPYGLGLLIAAVLAMAVGAEVERQVSQ